MLSEPQYNFLASFRAPRAYSDIDVSDRPTLRHLKKLGYLEPQYSSKPALHVVYVLTATGIEALSAYEQMRKDYAEEQARHEQERLERSLETKQQWRHEWRILIVGAVVGSVLTLIVEHFADICVFISGLF